MPLSSPLPAWLDADASPAAWPVVPFPAGIATDVLARNLRRALAQALGLPLVIDLRNAVPLPLGTAGFGRRIAARRHVPPAGPTASLSQQPAVPGPGAACRGPAAMSKTKPIRPIAAGSRAAGRAWSFALDAAAAGHLVRSVRQAHRLGQPLLFSRPDHRDLDAALPVLRTAFTEPRDGRGIALVRTCRAMPRRRRSWRC
ncbi:hypothetical protein ACFQS7_06835 [Dankookia sp. GCM10030260]|uniref:hypothetical protein n=1 Tax=Dankookia sp. GCM10030260 TaxID=3273390 RepID=UPI00360FD327